MRCPSCGTEAIPGKRFCHACGARLEQKCPDCGASVEAGWRFCPDCGRALATDAEAPRPAPPAPPAPGEARDERLGRFSRHIPQALANKILAAKGSISGERKLVTVLFCDLVGSTAIAEGLDPEEYHELLEQYLELAFQEIYRFEGIVNQLAGDGMMALFGAPVAHEDAPHRAVRAALAIREALTRFNAESARSGRPELRARIGIHTGPVVVGTVGNDLKMDYTAIGDTTNLAARLQSLAEPGTVLVSEATWRLIRGFFRVEPMGPLTVKGKTEPVGAYRVLGATESATPMAVAAARGLTPFVGRDSELGQLRGCFRQLAESLPQVVSVVGDAGSGKSRLLYEFRQGVSDGAAIFFEARCSSMTQSLPYAPWIGMLRQFFELKPCEPAECGCDKVRTRLADLGLVVDDVFPYLCRLLSLPADGVGDRPAEEIREQTFEAIAHLVVAMSTRSPVVMVIEDLHWIDDPSREMLELAVSRLQRAPVMIVASHRPDYQPAWRARVALTQLHLRRLADDEIREIVRSIAGGPLPAALEELILRKAEGNPFFAEEMTRTLTEEGYLIRGERQVRLTRPVEQIRVPDTIHELIGARLDRLGPASKRVVQVASAFGRQFRRGHLARLLEPDGIDVAGELRELEDGGIVHRKNVLSDDEFRFGESLTQEVAYEALLLKERRHLHERIARLLSEETGERSADRSALIAHHLARSDNRTAAVEALLRAALDAESLPSFRSAARFYREAWDIAEAHLETADGASEAFRQLAIDAAVGLCRMGVIYGSSDVLVTERVAPRAIEIARSLGNLERVSGLSVFHGLALASAEREKFADGVTLVEEGLRIAREGGVTQAGPGMARGLIWAYLLDGRFDEAETHLAAMTAELERLGDNERLSDAWFGVRYFRTALGFFRDRFAETEPLTRETYELAVRAANRTVQAGTSGWLAWMSFQRARYEEAREWALRGLEIAERIGNLAALRSAAAITLAVHTELGDDCDAMALLAQVEQELGGRSDMALKSALVVESLLERGEIDRARRFADLGWKYAGGRLRETFSAIALGDVHRAAGSSGFGEAERWYRHAAGIARAADLRSSLAHAELGQAHLLAASGDRERATTLARTARDTFEALGLVRYRARADRLLGKIVDAA